MKFNKLFLLIVIVLCLGGCTPKHNAYSDYVNIACRGWAYGDTLTFMPQLDDSIANGTLLIALRHSNNYIYRNIWLEIVRESNGLIETDTLNVELADVYGRWHGSGFGSRYQITDTIDGCATLYDGTPIKLRHIMRADTLNGIEQVGLLFSSND